MEKYKPIIVVSGLPRAGTSLLMQMLYAGGMEIVTDRERPPDENNPRGYFEYEAVKNLARDNSFMVKAQGKAIKIISHLLVYLPKHFTYHILFMRRNLDEIIISQNKMLKNLPGLKEESNADQIKRGFLQHLQEIHFWLQKQNNIRFLYLDYSSIIGQPQTEAARIVDFLKYPLAIQKMSAVVEPSLYRSRKE